MIQGEDRYARLAARLLVTQSVQAATPATEGRRDRVVAAMALAIAEKRRRRRTVMVVGAILAAAAAVLLMVKSGVGPKSPSPSVVATLFVERSGGNGHTLVHNTVRRPLLDGDRLVEGDALETRPEGSLTLGLASGTRLTLSAAAHLHVDELATTRRFSLKGGRLEAHVAKLGQGERFIVDTPDAEVEVRGTVFAVAIAPADRCPGIPSRSTVAVSEGAVWVRSGSSQAVLHPGESWTLPCAGSVAGSPSTAEPPSSPEPAAPGVGRAPRPTRHASAGSSRPTPLPTPALDLPAPPAPEPAPAPVPHASRLAEQNNLFSAAMAAEHRGDHATALTHLDQLIERFPNGPLLESARAERQRILSARH
jgi:hypothetical protein